MRVRVRLGLVCGFLLSVGLVHTAQPAAAACSLEQTKFVRAAGVGPVFGNRGRVYVYYRPLAQSCGSVANTVHVLVSQANALQYIEEGTQQNSARSGERNGARPVTAYS